ncbi:hypothetical protein [Candidatus Tisiphia endosymbiont of Nemotelus uliginosus]|uniref:hypothetical protein n=1 Tax=Candidatus Tisiphia endosymbiont of Nemotelus uliginosus TaxID=3077926 RepID=UPI0035C8CDC7
MQKSKVVTLTLQEKEALVDHIKESSLNEDDKQVIIELLNLYDDLKEKLKSSNISVKKLQEMLLGFKSDKIKKLLQIQ